MPTSSQSLGLGLCIPLSLKVLTAPAERIALLLQTQDEIILNLRDESLTAHLHGHQHIPESSGICSITDKVEYKVSDDDDDEPRSIISPYAQLPYTDAKDCYRRLVEKEGRRSLWRGYSLECAFFVLQAWVATGLRSRPYLMPLLDIRRWYSITTDTFGGNIAWILSAAVEGALESGLSMLVLYPLATLKTVMSTDVIRRTKRIKVKSISASTQHHGEERDVTNPSDVVDSVNRAYQIATVSTSSVDTESAEWIDHSEEHDQENEPLQSLLPESSETKVVPVQEYEYELSYKFKTFYDALKQTLQSPQDILGLYKGFSTVLVSSFVSRLGFLTIYRAISPMLLRSGSRSSGVGSFLLVLGATSVVNVMIYPLSTICHRRIVAAPGRYSSSWDVGKQLVEKHGWRALYNGAEVVLARSVVMAVLSRVFC
ncbi:hypothetical protein BGZ99_006012 [Dissophora globulifera]|uniref:ADP/ATP translocase n=1 Tax=Dissophora globulifera TaxID=979702 RepID=A0A9P6V0Y7_9FUNG|nr:hypothetical protein BGZ99_005983 [Dissophora globulifera]KAG0330319.1 hypothetical protein BGZ99_006012 [Dissophora globulifera]